MEGKDENVDAEGDDVEYLTVDAEVLFEKYNLCFTTIRGTRYMEPPASSGRKKE